MSDGPDEPARRAANPESSAWELDQLVAALRSARGERDRWDDRRCEPPSRDALIELARGLRAALFPSHFGVSDFTDVSIDYFVGTTLDECLRSLQEQVRRALMHATAEPELDPARAALHARDLVQSFAARLPEVRAMLEADLRAAYDGDPAASSRAEVLLCYPGVTAITYHRLAHELYRLGVPLLARVISEVAHGATGIDIHPGASIGASFFIDHGTGVVVGETARIGNRVRLYQGVTLGARNIPIDAHGAAIKGMPRHPTIEDDVVIYAGATILGRVTVGRGSTIGGNVWLTHSVPAQSHVTQAQTRHEVFDEGSGI